MTGITAKVIADSVGPDGQRITTMQLRYPRFVHAEFMTHRVFSRNASSSRAIPVAKMIEQVRDDPAMPVHWGKNQPGMQAREELDDRTKAQVQEMWREAARNAARKAETMSGYGAHKQIVNRLLEPWQWMHTIVTATEWRNFYDLRLHPDAQPEIRALAQVMRTAQDNSTPKQLAFGEWHLPYVDEWLDLTAAIQCSVARCARVSYLTHDGKTPSVIDDLALYERLVGSDPMHASPAEHQATPNPIVYADGSHAEWTYDDLQGNLVGWVQHRKLLEQDYPPAQFTENILLHQQQLNREKACLT